MPVTSFGETPPCLSRETGHVRAFMVKAGQEIPEEPVMPPEAVRLLRVKLILEELIELCDAYGIELTVMPPSAGNSAKHSTAVVQWREVDASLEGGIKDAYDAVLDLLVVVIGTAIANGTDLAEGWLEVDRSNMSKFIDGHRAESGKWIKGPSYSPANLLPILQRQRDAARARRQQLTLPTS